MGGSDVQLVRVSKHESERRRRQVLQVVGAATVSNEFYSQEIIMASMGPDTHSHKRIAHTHIHTHRHSACEKFSLVEGVEIGN